MVSCVCCFLDVRTDSLQLDGDDTCQIDGSVSVGAASASESGVATS